MDVLYLLKGLAIPVTLLVGILLKRYAPKLSNDLIPYLLFGGNFLLGLGSELTPAETTPVAFMAMIPVAALPAFLAQILNAMAEAGANTGMAMLLHAFGKASKRRILG